MLSRVIRGRGSRLADKKRDRFFIFLILSASGLIAFLVLIGLLTFRQEFRISDVEISGTKMVHKEMVRNSVEDNLQGAYVGLFARDNSFLYPKRKITSRLLEEFPAISNVSLQLNEFNSLIISIEEREPATLWCRGGDTSTSTKRSFAEEACYFMDENGYIFFEAPSYSGDAYFRYYGLLNSPSPVGLYYLPDNKFKEVSFLISSIRGMGLNPTTFAIDENEDLHITVENGVDLLFSPTQSFNISFKNLEDFLGEISITQDLREFLNSLEYIDLRFSNKIYYKEKEGLLREDSD